MEALYERLAERVVAWKQAGYPHAGHPAIAEILEWAGETETGELQFLRRPQLNALETYWYLRLMESTPHVFDLYTSCFPPGSDKDALLESLGVPQAAFKTANYELDTLWDLVNSDDDFVKKHRLQALRETLTLDYPSYILALAMGAGKTILVGAIIATEFAMSMEYPDGPFVQNALVFAPGKTIIQSLRELTTVPYERILPARMHKPFAASLKLTFTRDGERDVPVIRGSTFNVVVTNTEKIRIRKETIRKGDLGGAQGQLDLDEAKQEVANLRLQAIASLPHLAVFSDEAHHTYGQSLETGLKKVRLTVDYLAEKTNVLCVVNTTGTPYHRRQPLKDVVVWYGLSQGIAENILKDLAGSIHGYDLDGNAEAFVAEVLRDFVKDYRDVSLPNGAPAKIAMYFPQIDDLEELRPAVDRALIEAGMDPAVVLTNTSASSTDEVEAFNRLNDPASPHRVILLVNKGTEGWNCPSLFACALARRLKTSNNFVLQAASRCLRQVPGNTTSARVYLSMENHGVLDRQLTETYGESIQGLNGTQVERVRAKLTVRKTDMPPLRVRQIRRRVVRSNGDGEPLSLSLPSVAERKAHKRTFTMSESATARRVLRQVGDTVDVASTPATTDVRTVAVDIAVTYRVDTWDILDRLRPLYPKGQVPNDHLGPLAAQIEEQTSRYEVEEEHIDVALALVKPAGFTPEPGEDGTVFTVEIAYPKSKEHLLLPLARLADRNTADFGFHYDPYNFDSRPEETLFEDVVDYANLNSDEVEEVLFTGAITDPAKTDFFVEYRDAKGKWRKYTPDFVIRRTDGKVLILEVKGENMREDADNGENGSKAMAVRALVGLNPDELDYQILFARSDRVSADAMAPVRAFLGVGGNGHTDGVQIPLDHALLEAYCRRWHITRMSFFGSVLREDFTPESDVDVLVEFEDGKHPGMKLVTAKEELAELLGRSVDLVHRKAIEDDPNWLRREEILEHARVIVGG